jgi:hypothetical protein
MTTTGPVYATDEQKKKSKGAPHYGVVKFPQGGGQLATKFVEPAKTFDEALANTRITDENFLRDIVLLENKMEMFNKRGLFDNDIQSLTNLLTGMRSINGIGMNLAAMTDVDIYYPQGGGMEMSKDDKRALLEINRIKNGQKNHQSNDDDD